MPPFAAIQNANGKRVGRSTRNETMESLARKESRAGAAYQKRWIAMAGVTEDCALCPFGTIQTPRIAPARALQLYSIAGAKPMFQLLGVD